MTDTASKPVTDVVFDIGNVLVRWSPHFLYSKIFADTAAIDRFLVEIDHDAWNLEQDRGRPFAEGIAACIADHPEWEAEIRAYDARWQEMLVGAIDGSVVLLETLRARGMPTWAITNFSREKFAETRARFPFLQGFRDTVVSAHERMVKPDPAIYRLLLDRNGLTAANCLFIDDSLANVHGARAVGMQAVHFTTPERLAADLAAHDLPIA
jgi:2-haloacid dehalogenase